MPCEISCEHCQYLQQCGGDIETESSRRECGESCSHYDNLNQCCWQSGPWGIFLEVSEGDYCHLNYKVEGEDFR